MSKSEWRSATKFIAIIAGMSAYAAYQGSWLIAMVAIYIGLMAVITYR